MAAKVDVERLIGTAFLVLGFATTSAGVLVLREWSAVGIGARHSWVALDAQWLCDGRFSRVADPPPAIGTKTTPPFRWWRRKHLVGSPHHGWVFNARHTVYRTSVSAHLPGLRRRSDPAGNSLRFQ